MATQEAPEKRLDAAFVACFNRIDRYMRDHLRADPSEGFVSVLQRYGQKRPWTVGLDDLRAFASLRNVVVHSVMNPESPWFQPSQEALDTIQHIEARMREPECVGQHFTRAVEVVSVGDSVVSVLQRVRRFNFSQFPVYDGDRFQGLLTENGVTRWLARHVEEELSLVDFEEERVATLLTFEESKAVFRFIAAATPLDQVAYLFASHADLEAALITEHGTATEPLVGIVTVWDVVQLGRQDARAHERTPRDSRSPLTQGTPGTQDAAEDSEETTDEKDTLADNSSALEGDEQELPSVAACPFCGTPIFPDEPCHHLVAQWDDDGTYQAPWSDLELPCLPKAYAEVEWSDEQLEQAFGSLLPLIEAWDGEFTEAPADSAALLADVLARVEQVEEVPWTVDSAVTSSTGVAYFAEDTDAARAQAHAVLLELARGFERLQEEAAPYTRGEQE